MYVGFFSRSMNLTMKWRRKSTDSWMCFRSTWGSRTADPTPWRRRLTTTLTPVRQLNTYMATVFSIYQICFHSLSLVYSWILEFSQFTPRWEGTRSYPWGWSFKIIYDVSWTPVKRIQLTATGWVRNSSAS